jgi:hypothetical protein
MIENTHGMIMKITRVFFIVFTLTCGLNAAAAITDSTSSVLSPLNTTSTTPVSPSTTRPVDEPKVFARFYLYTNITSYNSSFTSCPVPPVLPALPGSGTGSITIYGCPANGIQIPQFGTVPMNNLSLANCLCKGTASGTEQNSSNNADCGAVNLGSTVSISTVNKTGGSNAADTYNPTIGTGQPTNLGMSITGMQCLVPLQADVPNSIYKMLSETYATLLTGANTGIGSTPIPSFSPIPFVWNGLNVVISHYGTIPVIGLPQSVCGATGDNVCPFNLAYDAYDQLTKATDGTLTQAQVSSIIPKNAIYQSLTITFPMCGNTTTPTSSPAGYTPSPGHPSC